MGEREGKKKRKVMYVDREKERYGEHVQSIQIIFLPEMISSF